MALFELKRLLEIDKLERARINLEIGKVWDNQPCGMEVVSKGDQVKKIDELMALREVDCPEIYRKIRGGNLSGKVVLELGCGTGIDSRELINLGADLTSVDFSRVSCELAKSFLGAVFPGRQIKIVHASSHATKIESNSVDYVYSNGSIHHSSMFPEICQEINRVLKPGGRALIMVYRRPSLMYLHAQQGRHIDYEAPVSLFLTDAEFREAMAPLNEIWRCNYYFARPHVTRIGKFIPPVLERIIGKFYGACQLVEFSKRE